MLTKHQYRLRRARLLADIETATKFGCRHVLDDASTKLASLERDFKKEHLSNPLFSYVYNMDEVGELMDEGVKPRFIVKVFFKSSSEPVEMNFWNEIKKGTPSWKIEKWARELMADSLPNHGANILRTSFIMGGGDWYAVIVLIDKSYNVFV